MHVIHEVAQRLSGERATKGITNQGKKLRTRPGPRSATFLDTKVRKARGSTGAAGFILIRKEG